MKKYSYDRQSAKQLLPLLESIATEINERLRAIRKYEVEIAKIGDDVTRNADLLNLRAELAEQRKGLRTAREELEHLGCQPAGEGKSTLLIPGVDGSLERGFRWEPGDTTVHRVKASPNAA